MLDDRINASVVDSIQRVRLIESRLQDFMGSAFSYAVTCVEYVELASHEWNVLLCRESVDAEAEDCGLNPMTLYTNGTLSPLPLDLTGTVDITPSYYANFLVEADEREALKAVRVATVTEIVRTFSYDRLQQPGAAEALRREISRALPWAGTPAGTDPLWNVLVERRAGGHYYYSEEQFNFMVDKASLSLAIFDRRCHTLTLVDGRADH